MNCVHVRVTRVLIVNKHLYLVTYCTHKVCFYTGTKVKIFIFKITPQVSLSFFISIKKPFPRSPSSTKTHIIHGPFVVSFTATTFETFVFACKHNSTTHAFPITGSTHFHSLLFFFLLLPFFSQTQRFHIVFIACGNAYQFFGDGVFFSGVGVVCIALQQHLYQGCRRFRIVLFQKESDRLSLTTRSSCSANAVDVLFHTPLSSLGWKIVLDDWNRTEKTIHKKEKCQHYLFRIFDEQIVSQKCTYLNQCQQCPTHVPPHPSQTTIGCPRNERQP